MPDVIIVTADLVKRLCPTACRSSLDGLASDFPEGVRLEPASFDAIAEYVHPDYLLYTAVLCYRLEIPFCKTSSYTALCPCESCCRNTADSRRRFERLVVALDARIREILACEVTE